MVGQTIGGMLVGFDQQIFRTTPPVNEMVAKGDRLAPVAASGGGTMRVGLPGDPAAPAAAPGATDPEIERPSLVGAGRRGRRGPGRRRADRLVGGRWPRAAQDVPRRATSTGARSRWRPTPAGSAMPSSPSAATSGDLPATMPPHAIHGTVLDRRWQAVDDADDRDRARAGLAVRGRRGPALRADGGAPDLPHGAPRRRADARVDRLAPVVRRAGSPGSTGRAGTRRRAGCDVRPRRGRDRDRRAGPAAAPGRGTTASPTCAARPSCAGRASSS